MALENPPLKLEELEISLLLEALYQYFGDDFRGHERSVVQCKLRRFMAEHGIANVSSLQARAMHEHAVGESLRRFLGLRPTALFENPQQLAALREVLRPWLRSCAMPKVWVADVTTAEEVFTLAILLAEEGFYDKTLVFATGADEILVQEAREGKFDAARMAEYEDNYRRSGGNGELGDYLIVRDGVPTIAPRLRDNIIWAQSNLATDTSFNEFQLIVCRKALTDFGAALRRRTLKVFGDSLAQFGVLCADAGEQGMEAAFEMNFKVVDAAAGIYRRSPGSAPS